MYSLRIIFDTVVFVLAVVAVVKEVVADGSKIGGSVGR